MKRDLIDVTSVTDRKPRYVEGRDGPHDRKPDQAKAGPPPPEPPAREVTKSDGIAVSGPERTG